MWSTIESDIPIVPARKEEVTNTYWREAKGESRGGGGGGGGGKNTNAGIHHLGRWSGNTVFRSSPGTRGQKVIGT